MIDDQAFYVGSQNLYSTEFRGAPEEGSGIQLNDYGYLIDDAAFTQQVKTEYWLPLWVASESEIVHAKGRSPSCGDDSCNSVWAPPDWTELVSQSGNQYTFHSTREDVSNNEYVFVTFNVRDDGVTECGPKVAVTLISTSGLSATCSAAFPSYRLSQHISAGQGCNNWDVWCKTTPWPEATEPVRRLVVKSSNGPGTSFFATFEIAPLANE
ncbi:MAG: hypothetical protein ACE5JF_13350 [Anaerolineales bacterium]